MALFENLTQEQKKAITQSLHLINSFCYTFSTLHLTHKMLDKLDDSDSFAKNLAWGLSLIIIPEYLYKASASFTDTAVGILDYLSGDDSPFIRISEEEAIQAANIGANLGSFTKMTTDNIINLMQNSPSTILDNPYVRTLTRKLQPK